MEEDKDLNNGLTNDNLPNETEVQENTNRPIEAQDDEPIPTLAEDNGSTEGRENEGESKNEAAGSVNSDIIRGHINTIILRALYERDKYGYEIINDIEEKSHGQYTLKQPTLYSALKRLETQGYIKAYWKTDEVSSGGRRKYFKLTDSGREITEKNLAEWEYSRTIIDSLISDRSFDFSQPAPTPVDFTILRSSVSRVPVIHNGSEQLRTTENQDGTNATDNVAATTVEQAQEKPEAVADNAETPAPQAQQSEVYSQMISGQTPSNQTQPSTIERKIEQPTVLQPVTETAQAEIAPSISEVEEARRRTHENYLRLISEPVRETPQEDIVPNSQNVNADALLYNNRPETERDYKNLIDGIFNRTIANGSVQTTYKRDPMATQRRDDAGLKLTDRGRADGVTVYSSADYEAKTEYATKTTYNKGLTLLKCSAVVLAVTVVEFVFCFIFLNQLATTWLYPAAILAIGLVQFAVFGIMALKGYGKNSVRPTTNGYLSTAIILTVIAILIISALSFIIGLNANLASDVMKLIVIPSITSLNITLFAVMFKLLIK